jgi:hypothetical protein
VKIVQLPRKIEVGTVEYPIRIVAATDKLLDEANGIAYFGEEDGVPRQILIAARLGPKQTLEIVLHEIIHVINHVNEIEDGEDEEIVTTKHGAAWAQFWIDNPKMLLWVNYVVARIVRERQ